MAKQIPKLNSGQAPSLLNAEKGNELINAINALLTSTASTKAQIAGLSLRVDGNGQIILDATEDLVNIIRNITEGETNGVPEGFVETNVVAIRNGVATNLTILAKS